MVCYRRFTAKAIAEGPCLLQKEASIAASIGKEHFCNADIYSSWRTTCIDRLWSIGKRQGFHSDLNPLSAQIARKFLYFPAWA
jgi:hypothetical protein